MRVSHGVAALCLVMVLVARPTLALADPIHDAAKEGDVAAVQAELDSGVDVNLEDAQGVTALQWSAAYGQLAVVDLLLNAGADPNARGLDGLSSLHDAANGDNDETEEILLRIVMALVMNGAEVDAVTDDGRTALVFAASRGRETIVRYLVEQGADVNSVTNDGATPIITASIFAYEAVVQYLVEQGADPDEAVFFATSRGHELIVKYLAEQGAGLDFAAPSGRTPLHLAADTGYIRIVEILLANGADVTAEDEDGNTPERYAADRGHLDIMQVLAPDGTTYEPEPSENTRRVQELLVEVGLEPDPANGLVGQKTRAAVFTFQRNANLPGTGIIRDSLIDQLVVAIDPSARCESESVITQDGLRGYVKDCDPDHPRFYNRDSRRICYGATTMSECFQ